jgi:lipoprotein-anchoring transpeptidase ErfK/SrfK
LQQLIEKAIASASSSTITIEPTVQQAAIKSVDTATPIVQAKQFFSLSLNLTYEGRTFKPGQSDIGQWIVFDTVTENKKQTLIPRIDESKVRDYVLRVAASINKSPVNRKVKIENGVSKEERSGQEGLVVDDAAVTLAIMKAVREKQNTLMAAIPTKPVAYKTEYNRVVTLDYGRYIEINLSRQRMWVYQDKQVIFETPITSGATGAGFPTVQGLFSIYSKATNRNLNGYAIGYNYNVFVKYWMPFSGNFGMHDASWRSAFGGSDYYYGGSHGCVNMPEHAAAFLYGWAPVGTPVWVHS